MFAAMAALRAVAEAVRASASSLTGFNWSAVAPFAIAAVTASWIRWAMPLISVVADAATVVIAVTESESFCRVGFMVVSFVAGGICPPAVATTAASSRSD